MHPLKQAVLVMGIGSLAACAANEPPAVAREARAVELSGTTFIARDTTVEAIFEATGIAEPYAQATLSTKLMGTVLEVSVKEGDRVRAGQVMARIDARDLDAKARQVQSGIASARAAQREALQMATRMRALYADSAAPKAQLDAAEAALARADAGVHAAQSSEAEVEAIAGYATIRAPFDGVVTQRFVDRGAFASPGAPLVTVQDVGRLRLSVTVPPSAVRDGRIRRGSRVAATVEGNATTAVIEGVVPAPSGSVYTVNALVENRAGELPSGGAATLAITMGTRHAILVPRNAVRREGDLTGLLVRRGAVATRWVRLGNVTGASVEILSGIAPGDTIVIPDNRSAP